MSDVNLCKKHSQMTIIQTNLQEVPDDQKFCIQCLITGKMNLILIENAQEQLIKHKKLLINQKTKEGQNNLDQLITLKENLLLLKQQISTSIDNYIDFISQQIKILEDFQTMSINEISSLQTKDINQYIKQYLDIEKSQINFKENKQFFLKNLSRISNNQISVQKYQELLERIRIGFQNYSNKQINELNSMDSHIQSQQRINLTCQDHIGSQIVMVDINENKKAKCRMNCVDCIAQYPTNYITMNQFEQSLFNFQIQLLNYYNEYKLKIFHKKQQLNQLSLDFKQKTTNILKFKNYQIDKSTEIFYHKISYQTRLKQFNWSALSIAEVNQIAEDISNSNFMNKYQELLRTEFENWKGAFNTEYQELLIKNNELDEMIQQIDQKSNQIPKKPCRQLQISNGQIQIQQIIKRQQLEQQINQSFIYSKLDDLSIQQNEYCYAIAINSDCSLIAAGSNSLIRVFEIEGKTIRLIQNLDEHKNAIFTLNFMKRCNSIISGSCDQSIKIWNRNQQSEWHCQQTLQGHTSFIYCLILNQNQDLIISGSDDKTIKFWINQNGWNQSQTIAVHTSNVSGLSLNCTEKQLITCGDDKLILIIENSDTFQSKWNVVQQIKVEQSGYRLCFINDSIFAFQPNSSTFMEIYQSDNHTRMYNKIKIVEVKNGNNCNYLFPQQFIKKNQILINKNGNKINFLYVSPNNQINLVSFLDFGTKSIFGQISETGEFLVTWDESQKKYRLGSQVHYNEQIYTCIIRQQIFIDLKYQRYQEIIIINFFPLNSKFSQRNSLYIEDLISKLYKKQKYLCQENDIFIILYLTISELNLQQQFVNSLLIKFSQDELINLLLAKNIQHN
ncbi:unnamed protein product (macronuclear) [Paramecium tetraurelia]|uniref:Uncharacterized protein n=1 Tax=Paramecium tetraurelia TaxID=5888 RepID=A0CGB8_PARTE|nr:uncharacterized protein GSPATT00007275001 [Paramecium tetraurelia]CAK69835.1 unnamed protein product [Paramecium tetraurelia]|eukprot:XP_001437232.1 hypothetical protein (macronuclear) [Paramecium tetraurelia strain d4-2]